jgi:DNA-binding SARP family transcriptional activator
MVGALVEQWLAAVEIDLQRRLHTDPASIISPLTQLTASHPFRENLWSLLMTALYRVGRQADALETFRKAATSLSRSSASTRSTPPWAGVAHSRPG